MEIPSMENFGRELGHPLRMWDRVSLTGNYVAGALALSLLLAAGISVITAIFSGPLSYLALGTLCIGIIVVPAYLSGRRAEALTSLSLSDPLTGIGNRRSLRMRLEEEIARCSRTQSDLSILMIDVDKLKQINDRDGHRAGDEALRAVARTLQSVTRISDSIGRLGGDEFLVIAPDTNEADAVALAERVAAEALCSGVGLGDGGSCGGVELSIGISTMPSPPTDPQTLLEAADMAMYHAKQGGGGRVAIAAKNRSRFSHVGNYRK
jgi:diguanylate cyclase (GGDEF)-like protein